MSTYVYLYICKLYKFSIINSKSYIIERDDNDNDSSSNNSNRTSNNIYNHNDSNNDRNARDALLLCCA